MNRVLFDDRGSGIVPSRVESPGFRGVYWPHQISLLLDIEKNGELTTKLGEIPPNYWCRSSESSTAMENVPLQ